jgi:hypothetical protein
VTRCPGPVPMAGTGTLKAAMVAAEGAGAGAAPAAPPLRAATPRRNLNLLMRQSLVPRSWQRPARVVAALGRGPRGQLGHPRLRRRPLATGQPWSQSKPARTHRRPPWPSRSQTGLVPQGLADLGDPGRLSRLADRSRRAGIRRPSRPAVKDPRGLIRFMVGACTGSGGPAARWRSAQWQAARLQLESRAG